MGYELRRWLADSLPRGVSSGERLVALEIADQANDETRLAYGRELLKIVAHRAGLANTKQVGKVLGKLAARGIELRVPIQRDGVDVIGKNGQPVFAQIGHQTTYRVPTELELPPQGDLSPVDNSASGPPPGGPPKLSAPPVGPDRSPVGVRQVPRPGPSGPPSGGPFSSLSSRSPNGSPQIDSAPPERGHGEPRPRAETYQEFEERHRAVMVLPGEVLTDDEEEFIDGVIAHDYVVARLGDLAEHEERTADGMRAKGAHPKAIVNTILKSRGESEADYRDAQLYLTELPDGGQAYLEAAKQHAAAHFPAAGHRYEVIFAARLAQNHRRVRS